MWIVQLALRRPVTVAVMSALMLLLGLVSLNRMNFDIFPAINIPLVNLVWNYPGLSADEMEQRVMNITERAASTTVNGVDHIDRRRLMESELRNSISRRVRDTGLAIAQLSSVTNAIHNILPPGISPRASSTTMPPTSRSRIWSSPAKRCRPRSSTISDRISPDHVSFHDSGLSTPAPFGGASRQVMVNIDPSQLYAKGLSPNDVVNSLLNSNVIIPGGTAKIGNTEYDVVLNGSPRKVQDFNQLPLKVVNSAPVYLGDIAHVSDSTAVATDIVRINGHWLSTYRLILKHAAASTLSVVNGVKRAIPLMGAIAPKGTEIKLAFDQSVFVRESLYDVLQEGALAAALVGLMVLIFLGSWRSTLIVVLSIPLAIMTSIIGLKLSGQTINLMTLGGLALAIGMLVDDATVEVENIHRNHMMGKPIGVAILDGARQIAVPAFVGTLAICIVFSPVVGLTGVASYLFTPLALAVVYAMLASYLLSRTLVPSMARQLLYEDPRHHRVGGWFGRFTDRFEKSFERLRDRYERSLATIIARRGFVLGCVAILVVASLLLIRVVGEDFFPAVDTGMIRLHVRCPVGTRLKKARECCVGVRTPFAKSFRPTNSSS